MKTWRGRHYVTKENKNLLKQFKFVATSHIQNQLWIPTSQPQKSNQLKIGKGPSCYGSVVAHQLMRQEGMV